MPERPPFWTDPSGQIGQVPIQISQDISPTGVPGNNDHAQAAQIVRQNQPVINRFVKVQRQAIAVGGLDIHNSVLPLQDMEVYYTYVQGLERMHYHISPQAEEPLEEPEPLEAPELPIPPKVAEIPTPEVPEPPEVPEEELPVIEEPPEPEALEEPEAPEEEKPEEEPESPDFLGVDMLLGLAVEFGDKDGPEAPPTSPPKGAH